MASNDRFVWFFAGMAIVALVSTGVRNVAERATRHPNVPNLILEQRTSPRECIAAPGGTRMVRFYGDW